MIARRRLPELMLRAQDHPFDHPDSRFMFAKHLVVTPAAVEIFGAGAILSSYITLQQLAEQHRGLDYAQAFDGHVVEPLWFIEDDQVVTALLPSDY